MLDINARQKLPVNLEFWKAYTVQYDIAKRFRIPRLLLTYFLVLLAPFLIITNPVIKPSIAIVGAIWTIVALIISYHEKNLIKLAAKIQDEFDIRVFDLQWNKVLLGSHVYHEVAHSLSLKFKGVVDERWYGDLNQISYPYNIIICQRSNVVWDWRLRRNYFWFSLVILIAIAIGGILLSIHYKLTLENYIITIFFPSASAYILGFKELKENYDNYTGKQVLENRLNDILDNAIKQTDSIDSHILRQVQDVIYILRKCTATVPTWFHRLYRKGYDQRMQNIINKYADKISQINER